MTTPPLDRRRFMTALLALFAMPRRSAAQSADPATRISLSAVLILQSGSSASSVEDLPQGTRVCGGVGGRLFLEEAIRMQGLQYAQIPLAETFTAMQTGICEAAIVVAPSREDALGYAESLFSRSGFGIVPLG